MNHYLLIYYQHIIFLFKMARTKATKRKKGDHSASNMLQAIKLNRQGMSVRKAAKDEIESQGHDEIPNAIGT